MQEVLLEKFHDDAIWVVTINRPQKRNCVNGPTADQLFQHFVEFEKDGTAKVAILTGAGGNFCAGADLSAIASARDSNPFTPFVKPNGLWRLGNLISCDSCHRRAHTQSREQRSNGPISSFLVKANHRCGSRFASPDCFVLVTRCC